MSDDPYKLLGVAKTASQDEIKKAYRKLAKTLHPDLHPGDSGKQAEFQAVAAAYDLLGDAEKRRRFDAGEIDASGQERPERRYYRDYAGGEAGRRYDAGGGMHGFEDVSDIFAEMFRQRQQGAGRGGPQDFSARGADTRYHMEVTFLDAALGAKRSVSLPDGSAIELTIPAGARDGQTLRLRGKGGPGYGSGPPGDAFVTLSVLPDPVFTRDEAGNVTADLPIGFDEAILGAKVEVPTITGPVAMSIPKGSTTGDRLRLKGKGIGGADQFVTLRVVLPKKPTEAMEALARQWREASGFDPRQTQRSKS